MVHLNNDKKSIQLKFDDRIIMEADKETDDIYYKVMLPNILCSNQKDAEVIQQKTNEFISQLSHKLIKY